MRIEELYNLALEFIRAPLEDALKPDGILADDLPVLGDGTDWARATRKLRQGLATSTQLLRLANDRQQSREDGFFAGLGGILSENGVRLDDSGWIDGENRMLGALPPRLMVWHMVIAAVDMARGARVITVSLGENSGETRVVCASNIEKLENGFSERIAYRLAERAVRAANGRLAQDWNGSVATLTCILPRNRLSGGISACAGAVQGSNFATG